MRFLVPAAALLLGGAAFLSRGETAAPPARAALAPRAERTPAPAPEPVAVVGTTEAARSVLPAGTAAATPALSPVPAPRRGWHPLAGALRSELALSEHQVREIDRILEDRSRAVAAYEGEVLVRGWARLSDFEHRIGEIRELSYRRIAATLDAVQGASFDLRRPTLWKRDSISISIPEDEVVSLD